MKFSKNNRYVLFATLLLLYFIPIIIFSAYSISMMSKVKSWSILSSGFLTIFICGLLFFVFLIYWDKTIKNQAIKFVEAQTIKKESKVTMLDQALLFQNATHTITNENTQLLTANSKNEISTLRVKLEETEEKIVVISQQLSLKEEELQNSIEENKRLENKAQKVAQDFAEYKLFSEEQLKQKNLQLAASQYTIEDQRTEMEKRQEQICQLDSKVHDLSYEIKTLIHLHETDSPTFPSSPVDNSSKQLTLPSKFKIGAIVPEVFTDEWDINKEGRQIQTLAEACLLLRSCIKNAQKLTGANYYGNESSRFREFSSSHFTIDQRRLFDSLRNENRGLIVIYSQKENKLLFANDQTKPLLGCTPEKFVNDFTTFFQDGLAEWKKALATLSQHSEVQARLLATTRQGNEVILNSLFGVIPTGLFRNYVICVLYPN